MQIQPSLLVACLCADWCGTCKDYRDAFLRLQGDFPDVLFRWIDIEDEADLVDDVDVENFPTILVTRDAKPQFFGTVLPHIENLRRLIQAHTQSMNPSPVAPEVHSLAMRLSKPDSA